jgi:predicted DNA-binding protein
MLGTLLKWFGGEGGKPVSGKTTNGDPQCGEPSAKLNKLYDGDRGIYHLTDNDAILRLWLPVPLKTAMDEATAAMGVTGAKYLREFLVVYLYGAHELLRMKEEKTGLYYVPPPAPRPEPIPNRNQLLFSRAATVDCIPGLGKNIVATKIGIPQKIKDDLTSLAERAGVPLSRYTRELLVSHFLGHTIWPEKISFWVQAEEKIATDWESGISNGETLCLDNWLKMKENARAEFSEIETMRW